MHPIPHFAYKNPCFVVAIPHFAKNHIILIKCLPALHQTPRMTPIHQQPIRGKQNVQIRYRFRDLLGLGRVSNG